MKFRRLFDVQAQLDGESCPGLSIVPRTWGDRGERALARMRSHARTRPGGVEVVAPVRADGATLGTWAASDLAFDVIVVAPGLREAMTLDARPGRLQTYRASSASGGLLVPRLEEPSDQGRPTADVVAGVEISGCWAMWLVTPPSFILAVTARRARWIYYVLASTPELRVVDRSPRDQLIFSPPQRLDPSNGDPVGLGLAAANPGRICLRFVADRASPARARPISLCRREADADPLITDLPNPSCRQEILFGLEGPGPLESFWYHVIEL